jgi:hypothetical protein
MTDYGVPSGSTFHPLTFGVIYLQPAILPTPIVLTPAKISFSTRWYYRDPISLYCSCSRTPCGL